MNNIQLLNLLKDGKLEFVKAQDLISIRSKESTLYNSKKKMYFRPINGIYYGRGTKTYEL